MKVNVNSVFKQKWQAQWNACPDNKLFQVNPTVGDFYVWTGLSLREEKVITRARIGHTYFTHSYLLKGEDMPWRIPCHCPDTFIYLGFYVAFNTVQVISRRVVGRAEETST